MGSAELVGRIFEGLWWLFAGGVAAVMVVSGGRHVKMWWEERQTSR